MIGLINHIDSFVLLLEMPKNAWKWSLEPVTIEGDPTMVIDAESVQEEVELWETTLMGYVVGYSPGWRNFRILLMTMKTC